MAPARKPQTSDAGIARPNMDSKYLFGEDAELENRKNTGRRTPVQNKAPSFKQIGPSSGGTSANDFSPSHKSGDMKFSEGPTDLGKG